MSEPTSEWGKELVEQVHRIEYRVEQLNELRTKIVTFGACFTGIGALIIAFCVWLVTSVYELRTSVAVSDSDAKNTAGQINRIADDVRRLSDDFRNERSAREKLGNSVTKLETMVERFDRATPTPAPK